MTKFLDVTRRHLSSLEEHEFFVSIDFHQSPADDHPWLPSVGRR